MNLRVQEADRARAQSYGAVARQLSDLSDRTTSLATALRSPRPRTVGRDPAEARRNWPGCSRTATSQSRSRRRPRTDGCAPTSSSAPGGKQVVVDAKVPLSAHLDAIEAKDDETRA